MSNFFNKITTTDVGGKRCLDVNVVQTVSGGGGGGDAVKITDGVDNVGITDVAGEKSLNVRVTDIVINATSDNIETRSLPMSKIIDVASASVTYVCEALPGTLAASAAWRIKKITVTGGVTQIQYPTGGSGFTEIAANRASLTYV